MTAYGLLFKKIGDQVTQNSHPNLKRSEQPLLPTRSSLAKSSVICIKTPVPTWIPRFNLHGSIDIEEKDLITLLSDTWDSVDSGSDLLMGTGKRENESRRENLATKWTGETGTPVGSGHSISTSLSAISDSDLSSQNS